MVTAQGGVVGKGFVLARTQHGKPVSLNEDVGELIQRSNSHQHIYALTAEELKAIPPALSSAFQTPISTDELMAASQASSVSRGPTARRGLTSNLEDLKQKRALRRGNTTAGGGDDLGPQSPDGSAYDFSLW
ncbi:hypothetical protein HK101_005103 [Irineochytrium annulatum]|nr:hypothetical protein HK101_005103 [Irineochytrium annulatum]